PSATPDRYPYQNEPIWSRSEKRIARTAFDAALKRELHEVMQQAKRMANQISDPADLWDLERHLTQRRKEIDRRYDFRSSRLTQVFGRLLYERRVIEAELRGLGEDKLKTIHSCAKSLAQDAA
ncbi:MAG TPA: hypothetical protein VFF50_14185, partial [Candidatus Deferrimicrobiaceae bacterium]|nr:hypothetical protein [Candidatus Deferrimicrobiaceae bacterium]